MTCIVLNIGLMFHPETLFSAFTLNFHDIRQTLKMLIFFFNDVNVEKAIAHMYFCHIYIM